MRRPSCVLAVLAAAIIAGCGGGGSRSAPDAGDGGTDAADGGDARGERPDAPGDRPPDGPAPLLCNGTCGGRCVGLCSGICAERDEDGTCRGRCEAVCVGTCEGPCLRTSRPEAGTGITPPDARTEAGRPPDGGDAGGGDAAPPDGPTPSGWIDRTRATSLSWPPASHAGAMVYDARRRRVFMFGGWGDKANAGWEWDGVEGAWQLRQQAGGKRPSPRSGHALAYDSRRGKVLLYGGIDATGASVSDVWEWDGEAETWTEKARGPSPSRWGHALAYDESTGRTVLFGGSHLHPVVGDGDLFDTWEHDAEADRWTNRTYPLAPAWPRPRRGHALAFDAARRVTVLYGGEVLGVAGAASDLWEWDGSKGKWTDRTPSPLPADWPGPRAFHAMAQVAPGEILLFGNFAPSLWRWDGSAGAWRSLAGHTSPPARMHAVAAFDGSRGVLVLSGGAVPFGREKLADVWEWRP